MYVKENTYIPKPDFFSPHAIMGKKTLRRVYHEKYIKKKTVTKTQQKNFDIGSAIHCIFLEPDEFANRFAISPEKEGITLLKPEDYNMVCNVKKAIYDIFPDIEQLLVFDETHLSEYTFYVKYIFDKQGMVKDIQSVSSEVTIKDIKENELLIRLKPDYVRTKGYITELKTTADGSPQGFPWEVSKYDYDVQGVMTKDVVEAVLGGSFDFHWLAIDKNEPYDAAVYYMDEGDEELAREYYQKFLWAICRALRSGVWPGYHSGDIRIKQVELPPSRRYKLQNVTFN